MGGRGSGLAARCECGVTVQWLSSGLVGLSSQDVRDGAPLEEGILDLGVGRSMLGVGR